MRTGMPVLISLMLLYHSLMSPDTWMADLVDFRRPLSIYLNGGQSRWSLGKTRRKACFFARLGLQHCILEL